MRNRIHRLLGRQHGLEMPQVSDLFGKKGRAALAKLMLSSPDDLLLRQQLTMLERLGAQIRELEERIRVSGQDDPTVGLLATIPGLGPILGNVIATEIDGIGRFDQSDRLCAYAGLIPTTSSSGDKTYHGRLVNGLQQVAAVGVGGSRVGGRRLFALFRRALSSPPLPRQESQHRDPDHGAEDVPNYLLCAARTAALSVARVEPEFPRLLSSRTDEASRVSGFAGVLGQSREPGI